MCIKRWGKPPIGQHHRQPAPQHPPALTSTAMTTYKKDDAPAQWNNLTRQQRSRHPSLLNQPQATMRNCL
ncbi:hypothetical protein L208DRAFT_1407521 [Tricholoma matsutake]|nr:hypothetical protein L208DRAFT_1407521 [Tricholoma matsutake 945]